MSMEQQFGRSRRLTRNRPSGRVRNARRVLIAASAMALALLPSNPLVVTASDPTGSTSGSVTSEQAAALRFRTSLGFESGLDLVRAAENDRQGYPNDDFGIPLRAAEAAELYRRMDVQWAMVPAMVYGNSEPEFAGAFIDQLAGGVPVFLFTGNLDTHENNIIKALKEPLEHRVEKAERSLNELLELQAAIDLERPALHAAGTRIIETGIRTDRNAVSVGIEGNSAERAARVTKRFGTGLLFEEARPAHADACTSGANCRPIKGGITVDSENGWECTSGFIVKQSGSGPLRVLTAGHCLHAAGGPNVAWRHNGNGFGRALQDTWQPGYTRTADVGLISIFSDDLALMTRDNDMHGGAGRVYPAVDMHPGAGQVVGMSACRYGRNGGYDCGLINQLYANRLSCIGTPPNTTCVTVTKTIRVDFDSLGGDSGGPVWYYRNLNPGLGAVALGTHVHSEYEVPGPYQDPAPWYGWYSPIDVGAAQYNSNWGYTYSLCVTQSC